MNLFKMWALIRRHLLLQLRDAMKIFDVTFWPLIDITLWGFVGFWMQRALGADSMLMFIPVVGALYWQVLVRTCQDVAMGLLEELWSKNFTNLASSPLLGAEALGAFMVLSLIRGSFVFVLCSIIMVWLYNFNILMFGWWMVPIICLLAVSGWTLGFLAMALMLRWGQRVQAFTWMLSWAFTTFCGVFYSPDILPTWMQWMSASLPMTYVFKAIHHYMISGSMPLDQLMMALALNIFYFSAVIWFLRVLFAQSKEIGLARLEVD